MKDVTIKIRKETHNALKEVKKLTGVPIARIVDDLVKKEYKGAYKWTAKNYLECQTKRLQN